MTIIDLINHVGLENVTLQPLERDMHTVNSSKKHGCTLVTFGTKAITPTDIAVNNPTRKIGFLLWIQKDKLPNVTQGARDMEGVKKDL